MRRAFCSHQESPSRPTKTIKASKATKKDLNQIFFGLVANKIGPKWLRPLGGGLSHQSFALQSQGKRRALKSYTPTKRPSIPHICVRRGQTGFCGLVDALSWLLQSLR